MNVEDFRLLYEYNSWANHRTLDACSALTDEQFTRDLGSSFPLRPRHSLAHLRSRMALARALAWPLRKFAPPCFRLPHARFSSPPLAGSRDRLSIATSTR